MRLLIAACAFAAMGCGTAARSEAPLARTPDNTRADDAALVRFEARTSEPWSLRRADDSFVCALPCSYWVRPSSGLVLRLEKYDTEGLEGTAFLVPDLLPAGPGDMLTVSVDRTHGLGTAGKILAVPTAVIFSFMSAGFLGISIASLATGSKNTTTTVSAQVNANGEPLASGSSTSTGRSADIAGLAIGVGTGAIAALSWYWFVHDRTGSLRFGDLSRAPSAKVRVTPVGVAVETRSSRGTLTPAGLAVEF